MQQDAYLLDAASRDVVLKALRAVCVHRGWDLLAAHVRTNHVHAVVCADAEAQRVMVDFKAYASRALTEAGLGGRRRKRWSRHGSTRYLWKREIRGMHLTPETPTYSMRGCGGLPADAGGV